MFDRRRTSLATVVLVSLAAWAHADWPQWRGPKAMGFSSDTRLPLKWSATENVAWSLELSGPGAATPVIVGDAVYLTTPQGETIELWNVDRRDGKLRWKRPLGSSAGHAHKKHNMASPSPVTDDKSVFAMTGAGKLAAFDHAGAALWTRDLAADYGALSPYWGYGASPVLSDGQLYIAVQQGRKADAGASYLVAIDAKTGKTAWKVERKTLAVREAQDAYTTPAVARADGRVEIVVSGGDVVTGHDPRDGKELWRSGGLNPTGDAFYRIVASPLTVGDVVVAPSRVRPVLGLRAFGKGDVTSTHRLWSYEHGADVPSPASDGERVYIVTDKGLLSCLELSTGKVLYGPERLPPGGYSASPVVADGKVYIVNEDGLTVVLKAGPAFELLASNDLADRTLSSPAVSGGQVFIRTATRLYCLGRR